MLSVLVSGVTTGVAASAGYQHACALLSYGIAQCWGWQNAGQLGNGVATSTYRTVPATVLYVTDAVAVAAGYAHTCALLTAGSVTCWGYDNQSQVGNGTTTSSSVPATVLGF